MYKFKEHVRTCASYFYPSSKRVESVLLLFSRVFSFGTRLRILLLAVQTVNIFAPWGKREDDPQQRRRAEGEAAKAKVLTFKALN